MLELGSLFNSDISAIGCLVELEKLQVVYNFDRPIDDVVWPASLPEMRFGACFNQPITMVAWPALLKKLSFGGNFAQSIEICWAASVEVTVRGIRIQHNNFKP